MSLRMKYERDWGRLGLKCKLEELIDQALTMLYCEDSYLIVHEPINVDETNKEDIHVSERGIVFRFGIYLQELFNQHEELSHYNIDTEYNRNFDKPKILSNTKWSDRGAYPDLIVHTRGSNSENLLIIEFKAWWSTESEIDDKTKLIAFKGAPYNYKYALFVILGKNRPCLEWVRGN